MDTESNLHFYDSWITDPQTGLAYPPIPYPDDGLQYTWSFEAEDWTTMQTIAKDNK